MSNGKSEETVHTQLRLKKLRIEDFADTVCGIVETALSVARILSALSRESQKTGELRIVPTLSPLFWASAGR
jgi:hypothetical protein